MPLQSDLTLNAAHFDPANIDPEVSSINEKLSQITKVGPSWMEVGAAKYRQIHLEGKTSLPAPVVLPAGKALSIPSREPGRSIPCRLFYPSTQAAEGKLNTKGVAMHIHGGGWVLMSHEDSDPLLQEYANVSGCVAISVGYRLAPEHPFPAGPEDCYDAGEYLVDHAVEEYGGPLRFVGGESAGGHLSVLTCFHLLRTRPNHAFTGLLLHFGVYDLSLLPSAHSSMSPPVLDRSAMEAFVKAFLPHLFPLSSFASLASLRDPAISPFYEDLEKHRGRLPPALFTVGTKDILLDDSVLMATRWAMAGGKQILRTLEGGCHGYIIFPGHKYSVQKVGIEVTKEFIEEVMGGI